MKIRFTVGNYTTSRQRVEKRIVTGCTIFPILFVMGMNMVTIAAERETWGAKDGLSDLSITDQRLCGRSYSDTNNPYSGEMGPVSTGRYLSEASMKFKARNPGVSY